MSQLQNSLSFGSQWINSENVAQFLIQRMFLAFLWQLRSCVFESLDYQYIILFTFFHIFWFFSLEAWSNAVITNDNKLTFLFFDTRVNKTMLRVSNCRLPDFQDFRVFFTSFPCAFHRCDRDSEPIICHVLHRCDKDSLPITYVFCIFQFCFI